MHVTLIPGSIRKDSFNRNLAEAVSKLSFDGLTMSVVDIKDIPLFSEDNEAVSIPDAVTAAVEEVKRADGVVIVTPEYNGYPSGAMVNVLDWLSRGSVGEPLKNKLVATMGASPSGNGTIRSQNAIRGLLSNLGMVLLPVKQLRVGGAHEKIGNQGNFLDAGTESDAKVFVESFIEWINKVK